jgi:hypothetical protein
MTLLLVGLGWLLFCLACNVASLLLLLLLLGLFQMPLLLQR